MIVSEEQRSSSGFVTEMYYDSEMLRRDGVEELRGYPPPGCFPYTRGFSPHGYRERFWAWEMYAGFGSSEEANRRYRFLLENGATGGISVALDLPTQLGYDSDDPMAVSEVGRNGVALDCLGDVEEMLSGVDLAAAGHVFSTANCIGPVFYAWILCHCRRHGIDVSSFRLQIQNDPIKEYVARGTHFLPIEAAVRLATDVVVYSHQVTPTWLPISVSGSHMKQAGASPAQEAAFTIANAVAYLEDVAAKGLSLDEFEPNLELHFCTDMDFFEEVAKYRAVRRAWSQLAVQRFGVRPDRVPFRLHAATSGLPLTAQQPMNNITRITLQVLAQVLGGVEATRTASWDEALAIPTEEAAVLSLRINQVIAHETGVAATTDPLGGSFYVEALTERIARVIGEELEKIDAMGGALEAVHSGYYAKALSKGAYEQQCALERNERVVVGVNRYQQEQQIAYPRFKTDETSEARQVARLRRHRQTRDGAAAQAALAAMRVVCGTSENVVPSVVAAVDAGATIGEIAAVWRETFGEFAATNVYF
jgi:methylmalonyl-CoA mutase N-terminal domain/subunit